MADIGHEETEEVLKELEKRIFGEYSDAQKELEDKIEDYFRRFAVKDKLKLRALANGMITQKEYDEWKLGQVLIGERWIEMRDTIAEDLTHAAEIAQGITNSYMPSIYAINHNYGAFQVEQVAGVNTSYTLYDKDSFQRMFQDVKVYHDAGWKVEKHLNEGKLLQWNKKEVQSVMTQAILQGKSIPALAKSLHNAVGDSILAEDIKNRAKMTAEQISKELVRRNRNASIRNARTMTTGVQNAGRVDSYKRAEGMGIDLMKEWLATLDGRTRHEHRILDGQRVPVGEKFKVEGYEIEYPADPTAEAFLVYNCRCTLVPALKGFEVDSKDLSLRNTNHMDEASYEEWKNNHPSHSDPIDKQIKQSERSKAYYNAEYDRMQKGKKSSTNDFVDWPPKGIPVSKEKLKELKDYGKQFNIQINNFDEFDGNIEDIKKMVDSIVDVSKDFPKILQGKHAIQLQLDHHMRSSEFAESFGTVIHINADAFRDMSILRREYNKKVEEGWFIKGTTADSIIYHELGHAVQSYYNLNEVGIAKEVFGKDSRVAIRNFALKELSEYAGFKLNGQEVIAECFSSYYSSEIKNDIALNYVEKCINITSKERD